MTTRSRPTARTARRSLLVLAAGGALLALGACAPSSAKVARGDITQTRQGMESGVYRLDVAEDSLEGERSRMKATAAEQERALEALYEGHGFSW